ncbi:hypothetical protein BDV18DRAFT_59901 [Aspergillus unguis]
MTPVAQVTPLFQLKPTVTNPRLTRMQQSWTTLSPLWTIVLWALLLPVSVLAGETTESSAGVSQVESPDQSIDILPVAPPNHDHDHHELYARGSQSTSTSSSFNFPTPFDTSLSNNFTSTTCPSFFKSFLTDTSFTSCHAVSALLRDSTGFFHTLTSAASTSRVLDIACSVDVSSCSSTLSDLASDLRDDSNCGQDFDAGNPLVTDAYYDLITYEPIYRATCLQNPDTNDYCFVDAVTNTSNPADYDVYSLPYGSTLDGDSLPTCSACLQASLDIFSKWAQVEEQPLVNSYMPSADAVNGKCGSGFANVNVTLGVEDEVSSAALSRSTRSLPLWVVAMSVGVALVL